MTDKNLTSSLRALLGPAGVVTDPGELHVYRSDGFTVAHALPMAVVFPTSTEQVQQVMRLCAEHGANVVARGSGTGLAGGTAAFGDAVVVSTVRMSRILSIDLENRVAHVEAGVRNTQLTDAVNLLPGGREYQFAPDPSSQRASTIGGNAATNAGGVHTLRDFVTSNHVFGIEMVLPDGSLLDCGGAGGCCEDGPFDLPGLLCGSEGTLGIITALWVRLAPRPEAFRTGVAVFDSSAGACEAVADVIASGLLPAAMEMLDGRMVQVIEDAYNLGIPPHAKAFVLTEIDGPRELLDLQMKTIEAASLRHGAIRFEASADPARRKELWRARKAAFGAIGRISHSYCTQDACVPRSALAAVLAQIDAIGREFGLTITNVFHAGDGNIHPIFLYDDRDPAQVGVALAAAEKVLRACIAVGGTVTGEHGVGVEKIGLMRQMFDAETMAAFADVRAAFDPQGRANPGKLLPSERVTISLVTPGRHVPQ